MPESPTSAKSSYGNFNLIAHEKANGLIDVYKYKSSKTGLKVVLAQVEGPVVNGYFVLATETFDDDGLPHTLEHLIFLGSEDYPYKGVLDLVANRMLAPGSNAWTDADHTCYTVTTAGSEGFLSLMPIYIDHILYPTLSDAGYVTEVHHIDGEGKDAGVVYCEEEGTENTGESKVFTEMLKTIYPGKCGYKAQFGGKLKNLRESTNNTKVRNYHKEFYRPDNLTLIITGQVKEEEVFQALKPVEEKIISKGSLPPFERPWQSPVPPFTEEKDVLVLYPHSCEDNGMVYVAWRGPSAVKEFYEMSACSMLLRYLSETSISWLQKDFVEMEDPYASSVAYSILENSISVLYLMFENVPTSKLDLIKDLLLKSLKRFYEDPNSLSMTRMKSIIQKQKCESLMSLENNPHDFIAFMVIGDMLYGNTAEDLRMRLNTKDNLDKMLLEDENFWKMLLRKYLIDAPCTAIRGKPSEKEQQELERMEEERIAKQKETLGPEGLKIKETLLNEAIKMNEIKPPEELLRRLPIPDTSKICFHSIRSYSQDDNKSEGKLDFSETPVYMSLDDLKTNFVYISLLMNTESLSSELRPYLLLFLEYILEAPIQRGEKLIDYEEVVEQLEADTISVTTKIGVGDSSTRRFSCGPYCHTALLAIQVEPSKYVEGIRWLKELLFDTVFTKERLKIIASKIVNDVPQWKRRGSKLVYDLMKGLCFHGGSNHYWNSLLRQQLFLTGVLEKLDTPASLEIVLRELDAIRMLLTAPGNMSVHLAANFETLSKIHPNILSPWNRFLPEGIKPVRMRYEVVNDFSHLKDNVWKSRNACIVGLGCVDSAFLCQTVASINDYNDPDWPALLTFVQYLTQVEGPLWRQLRGQGLAYGYNIYLKPNEGLLYLSFYRSTNVSASYKETKRIVESYLGDDAKFEETLLDSAKSSLIFEIIEQEKCIKDVVIQSLLSYFKHVDRDFNKKLVNEVFKVTASQLSSVGRKYLAPLFKEGTKLSIICHPAKTEEISEYFQQNELKIDTYKSLDDTFLSDL